MEKTHYFMLLFATILLIIGVIVEVNIFTISALILMILLFIYLILKEKKK